MVQGRMMLGNVVGQVLVSWCPVVAELFLGVAASEQTEAHVHGIYHFFQNGLVCDASGNGVVALNGRGGLSPAHFDEIVSKGYHGLGADEEA